MTQTAYSRDELRDFAHIGPGTLAGRFLRHFWQPIIKAEHLEAGRPKRVEILGEHVTAYRGEDNKIYVAQDLCPHRLTRLSLGWVEGDAIRCFYHGWKFDGTGRCVEQPAEPDFAKDNVRIRAYPVREYLGLVFAYLGEGEAPEFPLYPEVDLERDTVHVHANPVPCNYFQRIENDLDEVHIHFVHSVASHGIGLNELPEISVQESDYGILRQGARSDDAHNVTRTGHIFMPNAMMVVTPGRQGRLNWNLHLAWRVPVNDTSMISFIVNTELGGGGGLKTGDRHLDPDPLVYIRKILDCEMRVQDIEPSYPGLFFVQDGVALTGQGEIVDRSKERLGRSDRGIVLLRRLWMREMQALAEGKPMKAWRRPATSLLDWNSREVELARQPA